MNSDLGFACALTQRKEKCVLGPVSLQVSPAGVVTQKDASRVVLSKGIAQQAPNAEVFPGS